MQAIGKREGVVLETCDYTQLRAWNTALPIGGRQVDYMRFFLTSSLVAFQPFFAQDVIEPGGQMMGLNRTTKHFIVWNYRWILRFWKINAYQAHRAVSDIACDR